MILKPKKSAIFKKLINLIEIDKYRIKFGDFKNDKYTKDKIMVYNNSVELDLNDRNEKEIEIEVSNFDKDIKNYDFEYDKTDDKGRKIKKDNGK